MKRLSIIGKFKEQLDRDRFVEEVTRWGNKSLTDEQSKLFTELVKCAADYDFLTRNKVSSIIKEYPSADDFLNSNVKDKPGNYCRLKFMLYVATDFTDDIEDKFFYSASEINPWTKSFAEIEREFRAMYTLSILVMTQKFKMIPNAPRLQRKFKTVAQRRINESYDQQMKNCPAGMNKQQLQDVLTDEELSLSWI